MALLVFPSVLDLSAAFAQNARRSGERVIGSASVPDDNAALTYDAWHPLPFISSDEFASEIGALILKEGVRSVFTPHPSTFVTISNLISAGILDVQLHGVNPAVEHASRVEQRLAKARELAALANTFAEGLRLSSTLVGPVIEQAKLIPGECSDEKAAALLAVGLSAPKGDVVEIGSFFGKSAYILDRISQKFDLGTTIAIDPWEIEASIQLESPEALQQMSKVWNWDLVFSDFVMTLQSLGSSRFNYIREVSSTAWDIYRHTDVVESDDFGRTPISGGISVLHIDGNHDEAAVREDFALWSQALVPGAWVVFDDYVWSQGNGPKVVGDEVIARFEGRLSRQFVAGSALFLKFKDTASAA